MRSWKRPPQQGTEVAKFSRRYFFSLACVAMAIISSFYWSGFPFDNLCESADVVPGYDGTFTVRGLDPTIRMNGTVAKFTSSDMQYRFCNQDLLSSGRAQTFPFVANKQPKGDEWMTPTQENVTNIFGWTAVVILIIVVVQFVWGWVKMAQSLFHSSYSVSDES